MDWDREEPSYVITGLVPVIPLRLAMSCVPKRDGRDKPGHDQGVLPQLARNTF
jgi:hypothetical protein